jgi:hypothetical protein
MLGEFIRTGSNSPRSMAVIPAAATTGMAVEEFITQPGVRDFFTKPTRQQLAAIPPDLRGQMPEIVQAAKQRGVQVSPLLIAYAATVQRNRGQQQNQPPNFTPAQAIQAMQPAGAIQ